MTEDNKVVLCEQYRHPIGKVVHDFPSGLVEDGEDLESAARRELEEETGYKAEKFEKIGAFYPAAGMMSMKIHYFLAKDAREENKQNLDPAEFINVKLIPLAELSEKIIKGDHDDLPSSFGILLYHALEKNSDNSKEVEENGKKD